KDGELRQAIASGDLARVREHLQRLERAHQARQQDLARAAARKLPPRAMERLARARQAYETGDARLLQLLRAMVAAKGTASRRADGAVARPPEASEAAEILKR